MPRNRWSLGVLSVALALAFVSIGALMRREAVAGPSALQVTPTATVTSTAILTPTTTLTPTATVTSTATVTPTPILTPTTTLTPSPTPLDITPTPGTITPTPIEPTITVTPIPPGGRVIWNFAAKFVCGELAPGRTEPGESPVKPGNYATEINIHNPHYLGRVDILKKVLLLVERGEPVGREPRTAQPRVVEPFALGDDEATMDDCNRIWEMLYPGTPPPTPMPLMIGYLVVLSPVNLDIVDLMTVQGSSVDIESIGISLDQEIVVGKRVLAPADVFPSDALPREEDLLKEQDLLKLEQP
jgi:hypothetical protein